MLHGGSRVDDVSWSEGRAAVDELSVGERLKCFPDPARRIDEERLERGAPLEPVATVDLDDAEPLSAHEAREADPVGTCAFDPEGFEVAERARPGHQVGVARTVRWRPERREPGAQVPTITLTGGSSGAMLFDMLLASFTDWRRRLVGRTGL